MAATEGQSKNEAATLTRDGNIGIVTMNQPSRRNAFSAEMKGPFLQHFSTLMSDETCRAIVLVGAEGNFCAGGDVKQMKGRSEADTRDVILFGHRIVRLMTGGPKPVIAAVEGYAYGAGLALASACDYIVAAENARFSCAFVRVGLVPDTGAKWLLSQRVGPAKAKELTMLGADFDGREAHRIGFANQITEPGKALEAALAVARKYNDMPPLAVASIKASFLGGDSSFEESLRKEIDDQSVLLRTTDHHEAVAAFVEKRKPVFRGK